MPAVPVYRLPAALLLGLIVLSLGCSSNGSSSPITVIGSAATPTFASSAGTYASAQSVTLSDATPGSSIYYTTDGSTPTSASTLYTGPISVSHSETLEAIATASGYATSATAAAAYVIQTASTACNGQASGTICTLAGTANAGYNGDGIPALTAELYNVWATALDRNGNLYLSDAGNNRVRKVSSSGIISTVAGTGVSGFSGDGGPATSAQLTGPRGIAFDSNGNLYIADTQNNRIRMVTQVGIISTIAGNGTPGATGDGGPATSAQLFLPGSVTTDSNGILYFTDDDNSRVRKVDSSGIITTVAGTGVYGFSGDGGSAISAQFALPGGLAVDKNNNLYIADSNNYRIRKVTPSGVISTIAGNGSPGFSGDGGPAIDAQLSDPVGIALDGGGNLYFADALTNYIRMVTPSGIISTVAGSGAAGFSGDGSLAINAALNRPYGIMVDSNQNLYIADTFNSRVRMVIH